MAVLRRLGTVEDAGDRPAVHYRDPVAHAEDFRQLRRDHQDRQAPLGQLAPSAVDLGLGADVHALRRLVEDEHGRLGRQPARQRDFLLVAARQRPDLGVATDGVLMRSRST